MANPFPLDKLPIPVRDGYAQAFQNKFTRIKMDDGGNRVYRDYESQPEKVTLTWKLNWDQLALFDAWVEYELNGGVVWFDLALSPILPTYSYKFLTSPVNNFDTNSGRWVVNVDAYRIVPGPPVKALAYFPTWPDSLPEPEKSGYSYSVPDHVTYGNVAGGTPESRVRFVERITTYNAKWFLTQDQYEVFQEFVNDEIAAGTAFFKAPFSNGIGYGLVKGRFVSPPTYTPAGACWEVNGQLETAEAPIMSRFSFEQGGKLLLADTFSLTDNLTIKTTNNVHLQDSFTLVDAIFPIHQLYDVDQISFADLLRIKTSRPATDQFNLVDTVAFNNSFVRKFQETVSITDRLVIKVSINLSEILTFSDELSIHPSMGQVDYVSILDVVSIKSRKSVTDDEVETLDAGRVGWQDYADPTYFAEDYVYTYYNFDN